ncbi:MAG: hypothetical protein KIS78_17165 [Labilithrix sp.]|nr:hypothetical protein [Labilithrix sp.]MCW5834132.1 hypothetical protein [Labilithrix sp.]
MRTSRAPLRSPSPAARARGALARARARRDSAGAAMFIVAITLGILAAMGVYGLSATAVDIRAAGHLREAAQAQSAAEHALMLTAESFTPGTAGEIVKAMQAGNTVQSTSCKTANAYTGEPMYRAAQACLSWSPQEMANIANGVNAWTATYDTAAKSTFSPESFGDVPERAFIRVEVTNPVDIPPPPGTGLNDRFTFTQVTVTTFVDMKDADPTTAPNTPARTVVQGRGRLTVGPYFRQ